MAKEIKTGVTLNLKDLFSQGMNKAAGAASSFANNTLGAIERVDQAVSGTAAKLAAFGLTLSVGAAAKGIIEMDHRMTRLGISVNATADQIVDLKRSIFDVAQESDIKIDPTILLNGIDAVISKTSDLAYAEDNVRNIALAIQATGESGEAIGGIFAEFQKFGYTSEQISSFMDDMAAQANEGAFSLGDFAKQAPMIFSAYSKIGTAPENILRANTALQILNAGMRSPEKAANALRSAMDDLYDDDMRNKLRRIGILTRDSVTGEYRDFNDIMLDIAKKAENTRDADYINRIFSDSSMQAIRAYISHGERLYENLTDLGDTTGQLQRQSAIMAGTLQSNIQNLQSAFISFADSNLTEPLAKLTELLNKLAEDPERIKKVFNALKWGIGAVAAAKGIAGISRFVGGLLQLRSGNVNIGGALSMSTAMPVYVTNWGSGGMPGMGSSGMSPAEMVPQQLPTGVSNPIAAQQNAANFSTGARRAGTAAIVMTGITQTANAYQTVRAIDANTEMSEEEKSSAKGGAVGEAVGTTLGTAGGVFVGAAAAGKIGAMIGTPIAPGVGTAIGGAIGLAGGALVGWLGGKAGRAIGEGIGASLANDGSEQPQRRQRTAYYRDGTERPARPRTSQVQISESTLPPQITRSEPPLIPSVVTEIDGQASIDVNVNLSGERPAAEVNIRNNNIPFMNFRNSGNAHYARMMAL